MWAARAGYWMFLDVIGYCFEVRQVWKLTMRVDVLFQFCVNTCAKCAAMAAFIRTELESARSLVWCGSEKTMCTSIFYLQHSVAVYKVYAIQTCRQVWLASRAAGNEQERQLTLYQAVWVKSIYVCLRLSSLVFMSGFPVLLDKGGCPSKTHFEIFKNKTVRAGKRKKKGRQEGRSSGRLVPICRKIFPVPCWLSE